MPRQGSAIRNLLSLQSTILQRAGDKETSNADLAALARSWCYLEERRRILRGIPLPGQLRPDLDPVQLAKSLKRARSRHVLELAPQGMGLISDSPLHNEEQERQPDDDDREEEQPNQQQLAKGISLTPGEG